MANGLLLRMLRCIVLGAVVMAAALLQAEPIPVRFAEGFTRGFLVLRTESGEKIAEGDSAQVAHGNLVTNHLVIRFKDGSLYDDETVFSQRGVFRLVTDHVTQKGPSFKTPMETLIDTSKNDISVRYQDKGKEKSIHKHMELPADVSNGLLFTLVKDLDSRANGTAVSYVAAMPQPRLVKLIFRRQGEDLFSAGGQREQAARFVMSVQIGGIAGVVAPIIGKKPPDTEIWVIGGEAPTFARSRGPLYSGGPVWTITLVSPELASQSVAPGD